MTDDIDKRKPNYRDFPPTKETEKLRMWDLDGLSIDKEQLKKHTSKFTLNVDYDKDERFYESRVYPMPGNWEIKILSKIDLNTDKIFLMLKTSSGSVLLPPENWITKEKFREEVQTIEGLITKSGGDASKVSVSDCKELNKWAQSVIEKHEKEKV